MRLRLQHLDGWCIVMELCVVIPSPLAYSKLIGRGGGVVVGGRLFSVQ